MKKDILNLLFSMGIMPHFKGFLFMYYTIEILSEDYMKIDSLYKNVFDPVARYCHTTTSRVERDIRTAVHAAFSKYKELMNPAILEMYNLTDHRPTIKEFIAVIMQIYIGGMEEEENNNDEK